MKVYLDYILIENVIVNFVIMYQIGIFTKTQISKKRNILATLLLSIYTVVIYIVPDSFLENIIMKFLIIAVATYIAFYPKTMKEYIKKIIYYYIISFLYVGVIISFTLFFNISINSISKKISIYLVCGIITYLFNTYLWKLWKTNIKNDTLVYTLKVKDIEIESYIDTGNLVYEYTHQLDVIFLDYQWFGVLELLGVLDQKIDLDIHTVNSTSDIYGYIVKNISIYQNKKYICKLDKIIFSFANQRIKIDNKCSALIGYNLYVEKLKGVTL